MENGVQLQSVKKTNPENGVHLNKVVNTDKKSDKNDTSSKLDAGNESSEKKDG